MTVVFAAGPFYTPQAAPLEINDNAPGNPQVVTLTANVAAGIFTHRHRGLTMLSQSRSRWIPPGSLSMNRALTPFLSSVNPDDFFYHPELCL